MQQFESPRFYRRNAAGPDLELPFDILRPKFKRAVLEAARQLDKYDVRYAIVGGIAVGAHGIPRATKDVDFLVMKEDAYRETSSGIIYQRHELPLMIEGIPIDYIPAETKQDRAKVEGAPDLTYGLSVVSAEHLVAMKLAAFRPSDRADVCRLLEVAVTEREVRGYLAEHEPALVPLLERLVEQG